MPRLAGGATAYSLLTGGETGQVGVYGFQLVDVSDDTIVIARHTTGIIDLGGGAYVATYTTPDEFGVYLPRWDGGTDEPPYADDSDLLEVVKAADVEGAPGTTFATREDVQIRLGRALTDAEGDKVDLLLILATGAIAEACDKDLEWATGLATVPTMLRILCIEVTFRALSNPDGLRSGSESLGAYSKSGTYADGAGAIELTEREERLARRAVYGTNSASSSPRSVVDRVQDLRESRDVDDVPV